MQEMLYQSLGLGRSSGERNGNPLQYSCLENPVDNEAWQAIVHGVARVVVQLLSCVRLCDPMDCSTPGFPVLHHLPEFAQLMPIESVCHPTISSSAVLFSCRQSFPTSGSFLMSQLFKSGGFSFSISPSNENSGLISFRVDWFDLLAAQGTFKSLLQHHSSKA